jgi:hypothetical protein
MIKSSESWLVATSHYQAINAARHLDWAARLKHAFRDEDVKYLDRLTVLTREDAPTYQHAQLLATVLDRCRRHKLRSHRGPLVFFDRESSEVHCSLLRHLRRIAARVKDYPSAEHKLGMAVFAGIECKDAHEELARAEIKACHDAPEWLLVAAKHCLDIGCTHEAVEYYVQHLDAYMEWGQAAAISRWFPTEFHTTGRKPFMDTIIAENETQHKKIEPKVKSLDDVVKRIQESSGEAVFVSVRESKAKSPVLSNVMLPR